jgi:hypothetical protein
MTDAVIDILKAAKAKIEKPESWGKGRRCERRHFDTCCAAEAIEECSIPDSKRTRAFKALYNAAGLDWMEDNLTVWNDAEERTHAEVLAAFDLAIATLQL